MDLWGWEETGISGIGGEMRKDNGVSQKRTLYTCMELSNNSSNEELGDRLLEQCTFIAPVHSGCDPGM